MRLCRNPTVPDKQLSDQLWDKEKEVKSTSQKAEVVLGKFKKLKDWVELAKTEIGKLLDAKDIEIHVLRRLLREQKMTKNKEALKVEELELYIKMHEY